MFSPSFHVNEQGRVPMPVLPESPFYTMLPRAEFFGQNHMRAPCFRPVFMYMSKVGYRCPFCPKVRFTRCCPALRFLAKITCAHHVFAQFSCTVARSGTDARFSRKSVLHDVAPCWVF